MEEFGWMVGRNLAIDYHWGKFDTDMIALSVPPQ
jgi:hypothetical protein